MKKIFTVILLLLCITNIKAYENDIFKIDIPEGYELTNEDSSYIWKNDNGYISITINDNTSKHYNIALYTKNDLEDQKKYLDDSFKKIEEEYGIDIDVSEITRTMINDNYALTYSVYWPSVDVIGKNTYQKGSIYTTEKYILTLVYCSYDEIKDDDETYNSILNSLTIKDDYLYDGKKNLISIIIIIGIIIGIITYAKEKH